MCFTFQRLALSYTYLYYLSNAQKVLHPAIFLFHRKPSIDYYCLYSYPTFRAISLVVLSPLKNNLDIRMRILL